MLFPLPWLTDYVVGVKHVLMLDYELIIPSASRPHLLVQTLESIMEQVDQRPQRVIVHNDEKFPDRLPLVNEVLHDLQVKYEGLVVTLLNDKEPIGHGPSIWTLLKQARTKYVLYSQDDLKVIRPLPIKMCLEIMDVHNLHHVRWNKRATMAGKGIGEARWYKREYSFAIPDLEGNSLTYTLTVSDHWYFQTSMWRVEPILGVCEWWMGNSNSFHEHCEPKINKVFNGQTNYDGLGVYRGNNPMDQDGRATQQKTFIWGPIGEDRFIDNLGDNPDDWALLRPRGGEGPLHADSQARERLNQ
jgi:hypothetical protein